MSRYIDAESLIEAMRGRKFANNECRRYSTDSQSKEYYRHLQFEDGIMMDFVRDQPTAEVKPVVHGKWEKYGIPRCDEQHYICTNCNDYVNFGKFGDYYSKNFRYCPHCGADMRGVNE